MERMVTVGGVLLIVSGVLAVSGTWMLCGHNPDRTIPWWPTRKVAATTRIRLVFGLGGATGAVSVALLVERIGVWAVVLAVVVWLVSGVVQFDHNRRVDDLRT